MCIIEKQNFTYKHLDRTIHVYQLFHNEWRWRILSKNGVALASGEAKTPNEATLRAQNKNRIVR